MGSDQRAGEESHDNKLRTNPIEETALIGKRSVVGGGEIRGSSSGLK